MVGIARDGLPDRRAILRRSGQAAGIVGLAAAGIGFGGPAARAGSPAGSRDGDLVLVGASVVDVDAGRVLPDRTILIRDGAVAAVGARHEVPVRFGTDVIDVHGRFVIPGLWDSHIHSFFDDIDLPLYVVNGVTAVRELWGQPEHLQWRDEIEAGTRLGPRYAIASDLIDGDPPLFEGSTQVSTEADARAEVRRAKAEGRDFVKGYSRLPYEPYVAMLDEARRQRIPLLGHMPDRMPMQEALAAGQATVEHLFGMWYPTSIREAELRRRLAAFDFDPGSTDPWNVQWWREIHDTEWIASSSYSDRRAATMFRMFRSNRAALVPTLTILEIFGSGERPPLDERWLRYFPSWLVEDWAASVDGFLQLWTPRERDQWAQMVQRNRTLVTAARNAGVSVLAGTDAHNPFCLSGFGLHIELELLVRAGMSPLQALRSATVEPARVAHWNGWPGASPADLVVLDANPLADIANTRRVHAVVAGGRLIGPRERERILAEVEAAARRYEQMPVSARPHRHQCSCTLGTNPRRSTH